MRTTVFRIWLVFIEITFTREYIKSIGLKQESLRSSEQAIQLTTWGRAVMIFIGQNPANFTIVSAAVEQLIS